MFPLKNLAPKGLKVSIAFGNDLVPFKPWSLGNKPQPESILTKISDVMWHRQATVS